MGTKIQRIEINTNYNTPIHCPFCGQKVIDLDSDNSGEAWCEPCPHTLFIAHDMGFEYRSKRINDQLDLPEDEDEMDLPDNGIDGLTDQLEFDDAVKFAAYVGPPSFYGTYVGFSSSPAENS